jgi:hypothetical protein
MPEINSSRGGSERSACGGLAPPRGAWGGLNIMMKEKASLVHGRQEAKSMALLPSTKPHLLKFLELSKIASSDGEHFLLKAKRPAPGSQRLTVSPNAECIHSISKSPKTLRVLTLFKSSNSQSLLRLKVNS